MDKNLRIVSNNLRLRFTKTLVITENAIFQLSNTLTIMNLTFFFQKSKRLMYNLIFEKCPVTFKTYKRYIKTFENN